MRDAGCADCRAVTSGDCGRHGPLVIGSVTLTPFEKADDPGVLFAATATWLKEECERQHTRADKAEAELAALQARDQRLIAPKDCLPWKADDIGLRLPHGQPLEIRSYGPWNDRGVNLSPSHRWFLVDDEDGYQVLVAMEPRKADQLAGVPPTPEGPTDPLDVDTLRRRSLDHLGHESAPDWPER